VHRGESIPPENKAVLEQLAQYILRSPFSVAKMTLHSCEAAFQKMAGCHSQSLAHRPADLPALPAPDASAGGD
jgi:hypothetical protein